MAAARRGSDPAIATLQPSASDPLQLKGESRLTTEGANPRPAVPRNWQTERPKPAYRSSVLPSILARNATNVPALNAALWDQPHDDDSSSSSSSSDEDEVISPKNHAKSKQHGRDKRSRSGSGNFHKFNVGNDDFKTRGKVSRRDGRLNISVNETNDHGYLAKALGATFLHKQANPDISHTSSSTTIASDLLRPKLNIVVMVIGSRGDIQPFLKLGKNLQEYGHRVRIATHPAFKDFVESDIGLEFFSVGGDPAELMAFMVKNPGMIPTMETLKKGEVGRRREQMAEMFEGFWRACINATDDEKDTHNLKMMGAKAPFVADAIIANPPSFAHIHCAERLGIPLHLMFTFPYSPTQSFPHPLANIKKTNVDPGYANFMSYPLVEMMTWQGLGDLINSFRVKTLGLEPVSTLWAPGQLYRMKVPYTYLWSPGLIPKPPDWGSEIDIAGFVFLDLASKFEPPEDLVKFLDAGEPPVYIGFGSIVVDDPDKFTTMIFEAVEKAGVRALVSKGWGGLGGENNTPDSIFMLENTPHDWLFPKVSAVVHHGGAGTTAIGLKCGKPTMVVPFFGDQQFWGSMIGKAGAGAEPVPYKNLTADKLADGIKYCLTDEAKAAAEEMAKNIEAEGDGAKNAVTSFHRSLVLRGEHSMRCSILEDRVAVWTLKNTNLRLSALAAELLVERKKITWKQLRLIRHNEWNDFEGPGEPLTGGATAIMRSVTGMASGISSVPFRLARTAKKRAMHEERKKKKAEAAKAKRSGNGRDTIADGRKESGKAVNGLESEGIAEKSFDAVGQTTDGAADKEDSTKPTAEKLDTTEARDIHSPISPLGQHTSTGEPLSLQQQKKDEKRRDERIEHEHGFEYNIPEDRQSMISADPNDTMAEDMTKDVGKGLGETAEAMARIPMDLSLAVAQGFHNAPRLYGDTTVRRPTRITGMKSGLKAAADEFRYGIYDGVTGVVVQPYRGARDNGPIGFVKGVGIGLTGFVLKDLAAIFGPFAYTLKGAHKELMKGRQPTHFIRKAQIVQGQRDAQALEPEALKEAVQKTIHGCGVLEEVWGFMESEQEKGGLMGRVTGRRERKRWREQGGFENVEMAEKVLEAKGKGEGLEDVFREKRREGRLSVRGKRGVQRDLKHGK
ncbi:hypothetical protein HYALB_00007595, partial [Hymenoscyphus albidus]